MLPPSYTSLPLTTLSIRLWAPDIPTPWLQDPHFRIPNPRELHILLLPYDLRLAPHRRARSPKTANSRLHHSNILLPPAYHLRWSRNAHVHAQPLVLRARYPGNNSPIHCHRCFRHRLARYRLAYPHRNIPHHCTRPGNCHLRNNLGIRQLCHNLPHPRYVQ